MSQPTTLGQRIYRLRRERGMSQEELSGCLDVSRQSISKWETDGSVPDLDKLIALSDLFDVTLDALVKGETAIPAPSESSPPPDPNPEPPENPMPDRTESTVPPTEIEPPPPPRLSGRPYRKAGVIFLIVSGFFGIFLMLLGADVGGALLWTSPLLACGLTCLVVRRYPALWCGWWLSVTISSILASQSIFRFYSFDLVSTLYTYVRAKHLPPHLQPNPIGVVVHVLVSVLVIAMMVITILLYRRITIQNNQRNRTKFLVVAVAFAMLQILFEITSVESHMYIFGNAENGSAALILSQCSSIITNLCNCMRVAIVTSFTTILVSMFRNMKN